MHLTSPFLVVIVALNLSPGLAAAEISPPPPSNPKDAHRLWYEQPAKNWQMHALPLGNGRLGAMPFGGIDTERILLNENTLWIGDENDTGAYQSLGELRLRLHPEAFGITRSSPSHPDNAEYELASDGQPTTKWCFEHKDRPIIYQIAVAGESRPLKRYSFTSANDIPGRDPASWGLEGSDNGSTWTLLDQHDAVAPHPRRHETRDYQIANERSWRFYRWTFQPRPGVTHFQLAEIATDLAAVRPVKSEGYRRQLDLDQALHSVAYQLDGIGYHRELFINHPANVMVLRCLADRPGSYSGILELSDSHGAATLASGRELHFQGDLKGFVYNHKGRKPEGQGYKLWLDYAARLRLDHRGGRVWVEGDHLRFADCDEITLVFAAATNYLQDRSRGWKGEAPAPVVARRLAAATDAEALWKSHLADWQPIYRRLEMQLPATAASGLPTDWRLAAYQRDHSDRSLETLLLHYARYLMLSSSRAGGLPANLQGLWNPDNNPPWRSDYHSDMNVQMNYWFPDQANLPGCFQPFADWLCSVREVKTEATRRQFGVRGWITRSENGIFGGSSYLWVPGDAPWLAQNLFDHFAYSRDRAYLEKQLYPVLKELCHYWQDALIKLPDGRLAAPKSVSPEHGPEAVGNSYEQQLVYGLFTDTIEAARCLDVDPDFQRTLVELRSRLVAPRIGRWGQLQEWMEDRDDPKDRHRHISNLMGLVPGRMISPALDPDIARAAATSLAARGEDGTGWSLVLKIAMWARLWDAERAHRILVKGIRPCNTTAIVMNDAGGFYANLLGSHPPFQIDSNFGYGHGLLEMLLQSHLEPLFILPALPKDWPEGSIRGLRARGDLEVDLSWRGGLLKQLVLRAGRDGLDREIRYQDRTLRVKLAPGESRQISLKDFAESPQSPAVPGLTVRLFR